MLFFFLLLIVSVFAKEKPTQYTYHEQVQGLLVSSISVDKYGSQHIILTNTTNKNQFKDLVLVQKNVEYQHPENPKNLTIIPYFTYAVNATKSYLDTKDTPDIVSFGHYIDETNKWGDVVEYGGQQVTINLTSTPELLAMPDPGELSTILADQLCAAAEHDLSNNVVFIEFGDLHVKYLFTKTKLSPFSEDQRKIIEKVFQVFFGTHQEFGSVPGMIVNNFDGANNRAYVTMAYTEKEFENVRVVDEDVFAMVAGK